MESIEGIISRIDCGTYISSDLIDILTECDSFAEACALWDRIAEWVDTLPEGDVRKRQFADIKEVFLELESVF